MKFGLLLCVTVNSFYNVSLGFVENKQQNRGLGRRKSSVVAGSIRLRIGWEGKTCDIGCFVDLDSFWDFIE